MMSTKLEKLQGTDNLSAMITKEFGHLGYGTKNLSKTDNKSTKLPTKTSPKK